MTTEPPEGEAMFVRDGDGFVGTRLTQGGWNPEHANGGIVLALLGQCLDTVPTLVPMTLSRFTADLVRPVPVGRRVEVTTAVVREGKKIQVVELRLVADGVEHVRATALRLRDEDLGEISPASTTDDRPADGLVPPEDALMLGTMAPGAPGFLEGVDMRRAGRTDGPEAGAWFRMVAPVVAGEPTSPTARLTVLFDYANLIGMTLHPTATTMINPDVTAHVLRAPADGWVGITGDTRFEAALGRGVSSAQFSDADGVFAIASTSQLVQRR